MHDALHKTALALLAVCGVATALTGLAAAGGDQPLVWHRQFMVTSLGLALILAAWLPALRLPAIGAAVLAKVGAVGIGIASGAALGAGLAAELASGMALAMAGAVFLHEMRMEARWDGVLPMRSEV